MLKAHAKGPTNVNRKAKGEKANRLDKSTSNSNEQVLVAPNPTKVLVGMVSTMPAVNRSRQQKLWHGRAFEKAPLSQHANRKDRECFKNQVFRVFGWDLTNSLIGEKRMSKCEPTSHRCPEDTIER